MTVNRIKILRKDLEQNDKRIVVPFATDFDEVGRNQLVQLYEDSEMQDAINYIQDFETVRYSHEETLNNADNSHIFYDMNFITTIGGLDYTNSYSAMDISNQDVRDAQNSFTKSFFKFDFYNTCNRSQQRLMFSTIMPCDASKKVEVPISSDPNDINFDPFAYINAISLDPTNANPTYLINQALFDLGPHRTNNENYYLHWLKGTNIFDSVEFYMSCTFFNAQTGEFYPLLTTHQFDFNGNLTPMNDIYTFNFADWRYYKVTLDRNHLGQNADYRKYTYKVEEYNESQGGVGNRVGTTSTNPIKFFEYQSP